MHYVSIGRFALLLAGVLLYATSANARNEWDINHGMTNPPQDPRTMPGGTYSNQIKPFTPDFWQRYAQRRIPTGTVLTAILENDISSNKSKRGDIFTLTLQDGFSQNGFMVIPPNARIIGSINYATSAKQLRQGQPGKVDVSLQTLVFPDGRHMPIFAQIVATPNQSQKKKPSVRNLGPDIRDFGQQVAGMGLSFVRGPGFMMAKLNRGQEFHLEKGEVLPLKLTQALSVPETGPVMAHPLNPALQARGPQMPYPPGTANMTPNLIDPAGPIHVPAPTSFTTGNTMPPVVQQPAQGDPNAVFNQPLHPQSSMPDPF
jgi:hypothetical protein